MDPERGRGYSRRDLVPVAVLVGVMALFTYGWTDYGWHLYLSLRLVIFDFGINYNTIWAAAHGTSLDYFGFGIGSLLLYALVPIYWIASSQASFFLFLIAFEAAWIALGAVPIYLVVREQLGRRWVALALALAYLAFPALAGPVWYPFHYEALFPTIFLFGYWRYRRGDWWGAGALWTASLFSQVGAVLVIGALGLGLLVDPRIGRAFARLRAGWRRRFPQGGAAPPAGPPLPKLPWLRGRSGLGLVLLGLSVAVFVGIATAYGWEAFVQYVTKSGPDSVSYSHAVLPPFSLANLPIEGWTLLLLFGPLLGLPFLGREERWAMLPYLVALLVINEHGFWYPFKNQYPSFIVPVLFAAAIRGLERVVAPAPAPVAAAAAPRPPSRWRSLRHPFRGRPGVAAGLVLGVVLATGLLIAPWGPYNDLLLREKALAGGVYNDSADFATNLTLDAEIRELAGDVPPGGTLLVQNNLVEPLDRPYYTLPSRFNVSDQSVAYLLTDPYSPTFYEPNLNGPLPTPMVGWANYFLARNWSVLGEADGAVLLAAHHTGPPVLFDPVDQRFGSDDFPCCMPAGVWNGTGHENLEAGPVLPYDGDYQVISPGVYNLTVRLHVDDPLAKERLTLSLSAAPNRTSVFSANIPGTPWTSTNGTVSFSLPLTVTSYLQDPRFVLHVVGWSGPLAFESLRLDQTAPPPTGA